MGLQHVGRQREGQRGAGQGGRELRVDQEQ